jgi:hypothetical protein
VMSTWCHDERDRAMRLNSVCLRPAMPCRLANESEARHKSGDG